jgi:hypothetical protein
VHPLLASTGSADSALLHGQSTQECHNVYDTTLMLDPHRVESSEIRQPAQCVAVPNQTLSFTRPGLQGDGRKCHPLVYTEVHNNSDGQAITAIASRNKSVNRGNRAGLKCNIASCNYEGTFPRQWELQRHIDAKHKDEKPYWCPVIGCIKGRGAPAFARSDKLTAHIRAVHLRGSAQAVCPASTCANTALELDLLGVHVKLQHLKNKKKHEGVIGGFLRAIANAVSSDHRLCPLWFCKVRVKLDDFPSHLLTHTSDELDAAAYELAEEGYIVTKFGCEHSKGDIASSVEWCTCKVTSIERTCPLCASRHGTRQNLKTHIERSHVRPGEDMTAFRQRILALIGMEATQALRSEVWSDVACELRLSAEK